jgi:hypothetical protein
MQLVIVPGGVMSSSAPFYRRDKTDSGARAGESQRVAEQQQRTQGARDRVVGLSESPSTASDPMSGRPPE